MKAHETDVLVMDGDAVVQRCACGRTAMADGTPGVLWRGIAYPLLPGDRIDLAQPVASAPDPVRHTVLPGEEASWVLVAGLEGELRRSVRSLMQCGMNVLRSGRWLGEPIDGVAFDWFICCDGFVRTGTLAAVLGTSPPAPVDDTAVRLTLMEQRMADLLAELTKARAQPSPDSAIISSAPELPPLPDPALLNALDTIESLQAELVSVRDRYVPAPLPLVPGKLQDELADMLSTLRPDVRLLRTSWRIATGEFQCRSAFWRTIRELPPGGGRPDNWKSVRGADRWWERHVSNGQDDTGRAYARFDTGSRCWELLLSWKADQARDMHWLKRQP